MWPLLLAPLLPDLCERMLKATRSASTVQCAAGHLVWRQLALGAFSKRVSPCPSLEPVIGG